MPNFQDDKEAKKPELIMPSDGERREYPRIALSTQVKYSVVKENKVTQEKEHQQLLDFGAQNLDNGRVDVTNTLNLSSGGLLMVTDKKINPGSTIHVTLHMPLPGIACVCSMLAEVIRSDENEEGGFATAVKFLKVVHHNLNKYKYAALHDLLNLEGPNIKLD